MSVIASTLSRLGISAPRLSWRAAIGRLAALDALARERASLERLDDAALRDVGLTRADVRSALSAPDEHLRLILLRRGHEL